MYDRFEMDFMHICSELKLVPEEQLVDMERGPAVFDPEGEIGCSQMSQLFVMLGFLSPRGREQDQTHLAGIWKLVGGDPKGQVLVSL